MRAVKGELQHPRFHYRQGLKRRSICFANTLRQGAGAIRHSMPGKRLVPAAWFGIALAMAAITASDTAGHLAAPALAKPKWQESAFGVWLCKYQAWQSNGQKWKLRYRPPDSGFHQILGHILFKSRADDLRAVFNKLALCLRLEGGHEVTFHIENSHRPAHDLHRHGNLRSHHV